MLAAMLLLRYHNPTPHHISRLFPLPSLPSTLTTPSHTIHSFLSHHPISPS